MSPADDSAVCWTSWALGLGGSEGESVSFWGVTFDGPSLGGFARGVTLVELSFEVEDDSGLLPVLVGVSGGSCVLPAAGEGAMLLEVLAVWGVDRVDGFVAGEDLLGVGGNE